MTKKKKIILIVTIVVILIAIGIACIILKLNKDKFEKNNLVNKPLNNDNYSSGDRVLIPAGKPILYFYPEEDININVKLLNKEGITHSYPKYVDGWNIYAKPNGEIIDLDTGKVLYALYYEAYNSIEFKIENEGFVVKGEDTVSFLEEKLETLGLNSREIEEFIIYWLPRLEDNKYNYIRFATQEEIDESLPIEISPKPDTFIRIQMITKALDEPIEVVEQKLEKVERSGYTVVEWGATIL